MIIPDNVTCVMTSATLSVGQPDLAYFRERVGAEEADGVEDLIVAAGKECARRVDDAVQSKVSGLTAGMKLPIPGF